MIWFEAEELVKINLANNPSTYNNMFEQGWRLPTYAEFVEAIRTKEVILQNTGTYATSETIIQDNEIYYVCLVMKEKVPRKLLVGIINIYVYAKLCIDENIVKNEKISESNENQKIIVNSQLNIKNLKCCGNCMYYSLSGYCCNPTKENKFYKTYAKAVCSVWEFDARNYLSYSEAGESRINLHNQYYNNEIDNLSNYEKQFFKYIKQEKKMEDDLF